MNSYRKDSRQPAYDPRRVSAYRKRRRKQKRQQMIAVACAAALILALIIIIICISTGRNKDDEVVAAATVIQPAEATAAPVETAVPQPTATPQPNYKGAENAVYRPAASEGYLPVFRSSNTDEKIVAITVDDCYQAENFRKIVDVALQYNAGLTIFPIGENVRRSSVAETLKYAWENGMEIENHTYSHNGLYGISNEELAREMYMQNAAVSDALGVEYQCHFIRPMGGDAHADQRIHAYAQQLGYKGIAHWSTSGRLSVQKLIDTLAPGNIYLFHTTDHDLKMLEGFIPYLVEQGYRLVTLNEMFGYAPNACSELTVAYEDRVIPQLEEYQLAPRTYKKGDYAYGVKVIQDRLYELGYLDTAGDGIFGEMTEAGVKKFQSAAGLEATGKVDETTNQKLMSADAPAA